MGHAFGKGTYRALGKKIDNLSVRVPWNSAFRDILTELFTPEEADLVTRMPFTLSTIERIARVTGIDTEDLRKRLDRLTAKGLVFDLWVNDAYHYIPAPLVIGIFELTMMRTEGRTDPKRWAELFHAYLNDEAGVFYKANYGKGQNVSILRTLPHEEAVAPSEFVEVLDYEKAATIITSADRLAIGICSCRHEAHHLGTRKCDVKLEKCSSFGRAADYVIRHNMAREVSKEEMLDNLAESKEMGLVVNADNVQKKVAFMCHCCKDCCHLLSGIHTYGFANTLVTSNYIARVDEEKCDGCAKCAAACPIRARKMVPVKEETSGKKIKPHMDNDLCLGCGVCALSCDKGALSLVKRAQRVLHPETVFERNILATLERGTLQNQIFDNPQSLGHAFARGVIGAFLKLTPVKRALMSDRFRSSFLNAMKKGLAVQGKGWMAEL